MFLWKEHFETNPLYEQVTTLLLFRGSEQQAWFPTANHNVPITEKLRVFGWTTMGLHSPKIFRVNKQAIVCISNALALEEVEGVGKTHLVHTYCLAACKKIADLIDTQNSLVDEYICTSPLTQLSRALKIQKLATQCRILAEIIKRENYCLDEPKEKKYTRRFDHCFECGMYSLICKGTCSNCR